MEKSFEDYRKMMSKNNAVDTDKDVINYKGNKLNF